MIYPRDGSQFNIGWAGIVTFVLVLEILKQDAFRASVGSVYLPWMALSPRKWVLKDAKLAAGLEFSYNR